MNAAGTETRAASHRRLDPAASRRAKRIAALAMVLAMLLLWACVWGGLVPALYQALFVLAGLFFGTAAPQLVVRRAWAKRTARWTGAVVTLVLLAELLHVAIHLLGLGQPPAVRFRDGDRTMSRDSLRLGYEPDTADGAVRAIKRRADGSILYDVIYTLRDGLRATRGDRDGPCTVAFMIDSFAFGEGVNDADTLPQRFSEASGFRLNVVNLGFSGYGPQQMLARLEGGDFDRIFRSPLAAAYYISLDDHVLRIGGLTEWSRFDPRYALIDGAIARTGRFHSPPSLASWDQFRRDLSGFLGASYAYHASVRRLLPDLPGRVPAARALYMEALSRSDAILRSRYGVPLTILVWESGDLTRPALAELARRGVEVVPFAALIGTMARERRELDDGHPSPLANRLAGEALARRFPGCPRR